MKSSRQVTGKWGESKAADYLQSKGYTILERNVRTAHGEIDIVAVREGLLVFVEVRTRSSHNFGYPEESVTRRKQAYMLSAAEEYIQDHTQAGEHWQVDVLAVEGAPGRQAVIEHFENVIG
jgi:putative endonuclease